MRGPGLRTRRHPFLEISHEHDLNRTGSMYGRSDPICPGIDWDYLCVTTKVQVEFDEVFTLKWDRVFERTYRPDWNVDPDFTFTPEDRDRYGRILDEYCPRCSFGSGTIMVNSAQDVVDKISNEILPQDCDEISLCAELFSGPDRSLFHLEVLDLKQTIESIRSLYVLDN